MLTPDIAGTATASRWPCVSAGLVFLTAHGGIVVALLVSAWWPWSTAASCAIKAGRPADAGRRGSDGRLVMLPQFLSVRQQEDIIAGHAFPTYLSKKRGAVPDAVFSTPAISTTSRSSTRHCATAIGGSMLVKIWYAGGLAKLLIVMNVDAGTPLGGPIGVLAHFSASSSITIRAASRRPQPCC